jgi:23S rRNA (adenine2503-C2)-methyltransferase
MLHLLSMTSAQLGSLLEALDEPAYRTEQVLNWVWNQRVDCFERMRNLPADLRAKLRHCTRLRTTRLAASDQTPDGTTKLLLALPDGQTTETVLIPAGDRQTACVSTQVGCGIGCSFCASGLDGLVRDLSAGEIVEQVFQLAGYTGRGVTNVVFMGMGEPLANFEATVAAIEAMIDPDRLDLSARHVTVSTVGLPGGIRRLARLEIPLTLAISLHAPDDALRTRLIPAARTTRIAEILDAAREFYNACHREITLEYVLLAGVNDADAQADQLARLSRTVRCNVNLIGYNPVPSLPHAAPSPERIQAFAARLQDQGVNVQIRRSRGTGAQAACGQLRRRSPSGQAPR